MTDRQYIAMYSIDIWSFTYIQLSIYKINRQIYRQRKIETNEQIYRETEFQTDSTLLCILVTWIFTYLQLSKAIQKRQTDIQIKETGDRDKDVERERETERHTQTVHSERKTEIETVRDAQRERQRHSYKEKEGETDINKESVERSKQSNLSVNPRTDRQTDRQCKYRRIERNRQTDKLYNNPSPRTLNHAF